MKKCKLHFLLGIAFLICTTPLFSQKKNKGYLDISWGYNRSFYSKSNIHFKDHNYNFTLFKVKATDRPTNMTWDNYLNPERLSIPQYNASISYTSPKLWIYSLSVDHMKYVMTQDQQVQIDGNVSDPNQNIYQHYQNSNIILDKSFLTFEHTEGLNYINLGLEKAWNIFKHQHFDLFISGGSAMGLLIPKTNARLLNGKGRDEFHLSGLGLDLNAKLKFVIKNRIVITPQIKGGGIYMPDIRINESKQNKVSQAFAFLQWNTTFGYRINL